MKYYTDSEIIDGIAGDNNKVLIFVYDEFIPIIKKFTVLQGGTTDQANDLFQEAMIIIYNKIVSGKFELVCKFSTFLYAVCKRLWIQEQKKKMLRMNKMREASLAAEPGTRYGEESTNEAKELFDKHFKKLSPDCQKILMLYFNDCSIEEIRVVMGYKTAHHVVDRKYRCKKSLIERIRKDPRFRKF